MRLHRLGLILAVALAASCYHRQELCSRTAYKALDVTCAIAILEARSDADALEAQKWCARLIDDQAQACGGAR